MPQCKAVNKSGQRCRNLTKPGQLYCPTHQDELDVPRLGSTVAGALTGVRFGGPWGAIIGGAIGYLAPTLWRKTMEVKTKAFISFDFDNDRALRDFMIGQARNPDVPFEIVDYSLKEAAPEKDWADKACRAIGRADVVVVILGPKTRWARGVLKEVQLANELGKRIFQIIGYTDGSEEWGVPGAGRVYRWSWDNLKKLLA